MRVKRLLSFFMAFSILFLSFFCTVGTVKIYAAENKSFKVLSIGNSFSSNAQKYLYKLAANVGMNDIVIGNMYIGSCTLNKHSINAKENNSVYQYQKNSTGTVVKTDNVSLFDALVDEEWDIVTLQQMSVCSGQEDTYNEDLYFLIDYIKSIRPDAKIAWHMTWTYTEDYSTAGYEYYNNCPLTMYSAITLTVKRKILPLSDIDFIIPSGTAIYNLKTSFIENGMYKDGRHLNDLGCYVAGLTFLKAITDCSVYDITYVPKSTYIHDLHMPAIKEAVNNAFKEPYKITRSSYKCNHGKVSGASNTLITLPAKAPTCKETGYTEGAFCYACDTIIEPQKKINATPHVYTDWTIVKKATQKDAGYKVCACKTCGKIKTAKIGKITTLKLSPSKAVYTGKAILPTVTVKDSTGYKLKAGKDYTVKYSSGMKNVGTYNVTVTFIGEYSSTAKLKFTISPQSVSSLKATPTDAGFKAKWKKAKPVSGYIISYSTSSDFKKNVKTVKVSGADSLSAKIKDLEENKKYYVRIRSYKNVKVGKKTNVFYSSWSKTVKVVTKKAESKPKGTK